MSMVSGQRVQALPSAADRPPRISACERIGNAAGEAVRFTLSIAFETAWGFCSNFGSWTWLRAGNIGGEVVIGLVEPSRGWRTFIRGVGAPLGLAAVAGEIGFTGATVDAVFFLTRHSINKQIEKRFGVKDYLFVMPSAFLTQALLTLAYDGSAAKRKWDDIAQQLAGDPRDGGALSFESGALYPLGAALAAAIAVFVGFAGSYWAGAPKAPPPTASFDDYMNFAGARVRGAQNGVMRPDVLVTLGLAAAFTGGDSGLLMDEHPLVPKIVGSFLTAYAIHAICFDWYSQSRLFAKGAKPDEYPKPVKDLLRKWKMPKTLAFLQDEFHSRVHERQRFPASWLRLGAGVVSFFIWQLWFESLRAHGKSLKPGEGVYEQMLNPTLTQQVASFVSEWVLQGVVMLVAMKATDGKDPDGDKRRAAARLAFATACAAVAECIVRYTSITGAGAHGLLEGLAGGALMRATPHAFKRFGEAYRWCRGDSGPPVVVAEDQKGALAPPDGFDPQPSWLEPFRELGNEVMFPFLVVGEMARGTVCGSAPGAPADQVRVAGTLNNAAQLLDQLADAARANAPPEDLLQLASAARDAFSGAAQAGIDRFESKESKESKGPADLHGIDVELGRR